MRGHFKKRILGITARTALLSWLVSLMTLLIFILVVVPQQKRTFQENLESKAHSVSVSLRDVTAGAAINEDYSSVVDHCKEMIQGDPSLAYLVVTKNDGFSLIQDRTGWRSEKDMPREWRPASREITSGIDYIPLFKKRVFHYSHPLDYSGIHWGWIHVGISLESYDNSVADVYQRTAMLAILCIVISLAASAVYAKHLVKPILSLRSVVQKVAGGDLSARAETNRSDELGSLARSVNLMTEALLRRDKIMHSVGYAAHQFLAAGNWREVIAQVLSKAGEASAASRVYLYENRINSAGRKIAFQIYEWTTPGVLSQINNAAVHEILLENQPPTHWSQLLEKGENVSSQSSDPRANTEILLANRQAQSLLLIPITVQGFWWGFLGLDECQQERSWNQAEQDTIRAAANMLGAAIARQQMQDALVEAKDNLEQRVQERTRELQEQIRAKENALAELAQAQQRLVVTSREAGMAEVATGVLHNVGNVLNSVNVSTTCIREKLQRSEMAHLVKLSELLRNHSGDLGTYLTSDPKGKLIPNYLFQLAAHLQDEHASLESEHAQLARNVEHIKEIVAMQQSYARVSGFVEKVGLVNLIEDALQINSAGLLRHNIQVIRKYHDVPPLFLDKHKVLQILINLIHNAKYALDDSNRTDRQLTVSVSLNGGGRVKAAIHDNGVGIPQENLTKIFSHGFTTRRNGHGFGLHSGANAAKEMGGVLRAESPGIGQGATFTLELPLQQDRKSP